MGMCYIIANGNCFDPSKEVQEAMKEAKYVSDPPSIIAYKKHKNQMIPEIKDQYDKFINKKGDEIERIEIRDRDIGVFGSVLLSKLLPELSHLKELVLINTNIGYSGASELADSLLCLNKLQRFIITNNKLTDQGLNVIMQNFRNLKQLKEISFAYNELTYSCSDMLEEPISKLERLESLDLSGNSLNYECLHKIATVLSLIYSIRQFYFDAVGLKQPEIANIKKLLPRVFRSIS
jgi:Ran GTPase-activating protein (RanGAP) involved in mRNA processing and transport